MYVVSCHLALTNNSQEYLCASEVMCLFEDSFGVNFEKRNAESRTTLFKGLTRCALWAAVYQGLHA